MATGQPIGSLLEIDEDMLATLAEVHAEKWTRSEHMIVALLDAVNMAAYNALVGPHVDPKKLRSVKPPKPTARPTARSGPQGKRMKVSPRDLARMLAVAETS